MNRVAIAFLTKDHTELSSRTIKPLLGHGVDIVWIDGSVGEEGRTLPHKLSTEQPEGHRIFVHAGVRGGPDTAVAYALSTMLAGDYDYVGLCESDVLLHDGWFDQMMVLFDIGAEDGLEVGAVSARCYEDRILCQRDHYALMHNLGFGMQILTQQAARLALRSLRTGWSADNRRLFCQLSGVDIGTFWAFHAADHQLCADWNQDRILAANGLASLALTPAMCDMIGQVPPLDQQGLTLATGPVEARRDDAAFDRYVAITRLIREGRMVAGTSGAVWVDPGGTSVYFPHQVGILEGATFEGDWRLQWTQGLGPFGWRAGHTTQSITRGHLGESPQTGADAAFSVTLSGPCEFMVAGGERGGQVLLEDLKSGYTVKPTLPPGANPVSLVAPCGVSHRPLRLTMMAPGLVFHGIKCRERQPERADWTFDHSMLPQV